MRVLHRGVRCPPKGGVCPGGVCPVHAGIHPLWTERQTGVKTLPCRNSVADGNNKIAFNRRQTARYPKNISATSEEVRTGPEEGC